jgi:diguanylate cyclase (GGDEF)-like protein
MWPPDDETTGWRERHLDPTARFGKFGYSKWFAVPVAQGERGTIVLVARWRAQEMPPPSQTESIELFAAQAGASLRNAQVFLELQALKDQLAHEASHDALTELPNRRWFHEELERMCGHGRSEDSVGVLFLDLDGFKQVNDRFGHDAGNELLVEVSARLRRCVRPGDMVARVGGDEFTIMLTRIDNPAPAIEVADRICMLLREQFILGAGVAQISTSIGIALAPADTADPGDLVRRADVAMYRAKSQGKAGWAMDPGSLADSEESPDAVPGITPEAAPDASS